jgi:hypothetical protein
MLTRNFSSLKNGMNRQAITRIEKWTSILFRPTKEQAVRRVVEAEPRYFVRALGIDGAGTCAPGHKGTPKNKIKIILEHTMF